MTSTSTLAKPAEEWEYIQKWEKRLCDLFTDLSSTLEEVGLDAEEGTMLVMLTVEQLEKENTILATRLDVVHAAMCQHHDATKIADLKQTVVGRFAKLADVKAKLVQRDAGVAHYKVNPNPQDISVNDGGSVKQDRSYRYMKRDLRDMNQQISVMNQQLSDMKQQLREMEKQLNSLLREFIRDHNRFLLGTVAYNVLDAAAAAVFGGDEKRWSVHRKLFNSLEELDKLPMQPDERNRYEAFMKRFDTSFQVWAEQHPCILEDDENDCSWSEVLFTLTDAYDRRLLRHPICIYEHKDEEEPPCATADELKASIHTVYTQRRKKPFATSIEGLVDFLSAEKTQLGLPLLQ